jgi:dienelactone hydrolase
MRLGIIVLLASIIFSGVAFADEAPPIFADPAADSVNPASMVEITVPSHGVQLLGVLYTASGTGPHPAAVIFHGFPGYEQNLDLAQALRRAGYNVLAVHYRGSWGVPGGFSFEHAIQDADAQVEWISSPQVAAKYHIDATRVVVIGHSMGGYMALSAAAHLPSIAAAVSISGASLGHRFSGWKAAERDKAINAYAAKADPVDFLPLAGTSPKALGAEVFDHRDEWDFIRLAPALGRRSVLLITASDGTAPNSAALLSTLEAAGNTRSQHIEIKTDHPFSDHRIALQERILSWLKSTSAESSASEKSTSGASARQSTFAFSEAPRNSTD